MARKALYEMLERALKVVSESYEGPGAEEVKEIASTEAYTLAYYRMTQRSTFTAVNLKRDFFIEPHKLFFSKDVDGAWREAMASKIEWWDIREEKTLREKILSKMEIQMGLQGNGHGAYNARWKTSLRPADKGTYIHEALGGFIFKRAMNELFPEVKGYSTVVPGRIISLYWPWIAATPDGFTVSDENEFEKLVRGVIRGTKALGAPFAIHEMKTIHRLPIGEDVVRALYLKYTDARNTVTDALRTEVVELVQQLCIAGRLMSGNVEIDLRFDGKGKPVFAQRFSIYPTKHIDDMKTHLCKENYVPLCTAGPSEDEVGLKNLREMMTFIDSFKSPRDYRSKYVDVSKFLKAPGCRRNFL